MKRTADKKHLTHIVLSVFLMTGIMSCGGDSDSDSGDSPSAPQEAEQTQEGVFRGVLNSVNPDIASASSATQVKIEGDNFETEIFGSGPATTHRQFIHAGTRCPSREDDTNQDGVIDAVEGEAVYGAPLIPLDSELASNEGIFPFATTYRYSESASLSQMLANFNLSALNTEGKVMTIQGIPDATTLPATAQGDKAAFPISCGKLLKVD